MRRRGEAGVGEEFLGERGGCFFNLWKHRHHVSHQTGSHKRTSSSPYLMVYRLRGSGVHRGFAVLFWIAYRLRGYDVHRPL